MRHFFVINPHSFRTSDDLKKVLIEIENCFSDKRGIGYEIYESRYPRDAIAAVNRYVSDCPKEEIVRVYAIGGDGILFDCLNGMVNFLNAELTSVPYGNDNDFIRVFGEGVKERFRDIKNLSVASSRPIDIIHCGSNYAVIETQIGYVGHTVILARELFKRIPEKILRNNVALAYTFCGIRSFFNKKIMQQKYTIHLDGEDLSGNYCHIQISNGACNGGTMVPSPYARPDSGLLHIHLTNTSSTVKMLKTFGDYTSGHFEKHEFYIPKEGRILEVKSDDIMSVAMDGEGFHAQELKLEIIPGGIKFFAPEGLDIADHSHRAFKKTEKAEPKRREK